MKRATTDKNGVASRKRIRNVNKNPAVPDPMLSTWKPLLEAAPNEMQLFDEPVELILDESPNPPSLPTDYYQLGSNMLVGVSVFCNQAKVHIRQFVEKDGKLIPTRIGMTFTPSEWQVLTENLCYFEYKTVLASRLFQRELLVSTIADDTHTVHKINIQRAFTTNCESIQLSHCNLLLSIPQFEELVMFQDSVSACMRKYLFGPVLTKFVFDECLLNLELTDLNKEIAEVNLTLSLTDIIKNQLQRFLLDIYIQCYACENNLENVHSCTMSCRTLAYFDRAVMNLNMYKIAQSFVLNNQSLHPFITETYMNSLDVSLILSACYDLLVHV